MKISSNFFLDKRYKKMNDKFPLKISIFYNKKKVLYGIGIDLTESEFANFRIGKNNKNSFKDAQYYLNKAEKIIEEIRHYFSFELFREKFYNREFTSDNSSVIQSDILRAFEEYIQELRENNQFRTADGYITSKHSLQTYIGNEKKIYFNQVTPKFLKDYEKHLLDDGKTFSTVGIYTRNIRRIFNYKKIPADMYPFGPGKYSPPSSQNIKKALSLEDIEKLYNYQTKLFQKEFARDMWFFSYFANGINFKDIALMKKRFIHWDKNEIIYYRSKTTSHNPKKQTIQILINEDLKRIINKWGAKKGEYVFQIILKTDDTPEKVIQRINQFIKNTNKYLGKISIELGLSRKVTTNFARHSFSTVLKRSGVPIEMISEQLGHSTIKTTQVYLDSFESEQKQAAMKHLEAFKNLNKENEN